MFCSHYKCRSLHMRCFSTATGYDRTGMCRQEFTVTVIVCLSAVKRDRNVTGGGKRKGIKADKCGDWKVKVSYMFLYSAMRSILDKRAILPRIHTANGCGLYLLYPETHSLSLSLSPILTTRPLYLTQSLLSQPLCYSFSLWWDHWHL